MSDNTANDRQADQLASQLQATDSQKHTPSCADKVANPRLSSLDDVLGLRPRVETAKLQLKRAFGNTLYGTASEGGSSGASTVFKLKSDGIGFTILHSFTTPSAASPFTNSDGGGPQAGLVLFANTLYGTASYGGNSGNGTVFAINTDGTGFTN